MKKRRLISKETEEPQEPKRQCYTPGLARDDMNGESVVFTKLHRMFRHVKSNSYQPETDLKPTRRMRSPLSENDGLPSDLILMGLTRGKFIEDLIAKKHERLSELKIQRIIDNYSRNEFKSLYYYDSIANREKNKRDLISRHPYTNGAIIMKSLNKKSRRKVVSKLKQILPGNSRIFS